MTYSTKRLYQKSHIIEQCHLISITGNYTPDKIAQDHDTNMTDIETLEGKQTNKDKDTYTKEPGIIITEVLADAAKVYFMG